MRLTIEYPVGEHSTYAVHFHHESIPAAWEERLSGKRVNLWKWETYCTLHKGACKEQKRPCGTPDSVVGIAHCSLKDVFDKAKGRKLAFARALAALTTNRGLRTALWTAYLKQSPPKTKHVRVKEVADVGRVQGGSEAGGT